MLFLAPLLLCAALLILVRVWGATYYQRAADLRQKLELGMTRSQVYDEMDRFFPYVIETPTVHNRFACLPDQPGEYYLESAHFYGPFGELGFDNIQIVMCFDEDGRLAGFP